MRTLNRRVAVAPGRTREASGNRFDTSPRNGDDGTRGPRRSTEAKRPSASRLAALGAPVEQCCDRASLAAPRQAPVLRRHLVDGVTARAENNAVGVASGLVGDLAILHVGEHAAGVAVERVAVAGAARDVL